VIPVVSLSTFIASANGVAETPTPYRNPTVGRDVALQIPGMHRARVTRNLTYKRSPEGPLKLDVYTPRTSAPGARLPAVLFVHGSTRASSPKDWGAFVGWGQLAAASGVSGVTFNHRAGWTYVDTKAAIKFVRANARRLGIDARRIAVQTHSAGAPDGVAAALAGSPAYIRCIVVYYGSLSTPQPQLSPLAFLEANPASIPAMLVARAGLDEPELNRSIDEFVAAAQAKQAPVAVVTNDEGRHAFDVLQHTTRSREVMRTTLAFLREKLRG
jgi:Carboxylesterase family